MNHEPVMVAELLQVLELKLGDIVVDGTLGLGGHAAAMLEAIGPMGALYGFDWDETMLAPTSKTLREKYGKRFNPFRADYRQIPEELANLGVAPNAILLDLGLNNAQIEDPTRGISFKTEGPLDMRMDRSSGEPASALLNRAAPQEIERILWTFGDERWAKAIAKQVVERRKTQPLRTTRDLVEVVLAAVPVKARDARIHPATRTFQAVRIAVNRELEGLQEAVEAMAHTLAPGGTIAALSYHSGEDQAIKFAFRSCSDSGSFSNLYKKPLTPSAAEVAQNPKSRSAKLRALRKLEIDRTG